MDRKARRSFHLATLLAAAAGCTSISDSASGVVRAVSGSAQAILTSSGSGSSDWAPLREERYREDVRLATRAFVERGGAGEAFLRELGRVAERHGVTHWEGEPGTFLAVGAGLAEAGVPEAELDATLGRLGMGRPEERALARSGHRSARL